MQVRVIHSWPCLPGVEALLLVCQLPLAQLLYHFQPGELRAPEGRTQAALTFGSSVLWWCQCLSLALGGRFFLLPLTGGVNRVTLLEKRNLCPKHRSWGCATFVVRSLASWDQNLMTFSFQFAGRGRKSLINFGSWCFSLTRAGSIQRISI